MNETFVCQMCERTLNKDVTWTEEDAFNEAMDKFGAMAFEDDMVGVCEECYAALLKFAEMLGMK
jgi:NAD-dependent SIR2 family protein deacetylase